MVHPVDDDYFYEALGRIGLRPRNAVAAPVPVLRDAAFDRIAKLLELRGKRHWQCLTRTFTVLHQCSLEHFMSGFLQENLTDYSLPYTQASLPNALVGEDRKRFLACQEHVLASDGATIERGKSKHLYLKSSADALFIFGDLLGRGGFAQVEQVTGKSTHQVFALKKVKRWHFDHFKDLQGMQSFRKELETLQSLNHRHIINLVGSYTDNEYIGLLMEPAADENLDEFLRHELSADRATERCRRLRGFFGCIATAIDYLHNNSTGQVLHKDLKPANVLVKDAKIYIADFGASALRAGDSAGGRVETTVGSTNRSYTPKYLAPEAAVATRTSASDIWSLGCIFLEMLTVLADRKIEDLRAFFENIGTRTTIYHRNQSALEQWTEKLRNNLITSRKPEDAQLVEIVKVTCIHEPSNRIEAHDVLRRIFTLAGDTRYYGLCCDDPSQLSADSEQCFSADDRSDGADESEPDGSDEGVTVTSMQDERLNLKSWSRYVSPSVEDADTVIITASKKGAKVQQHVPEDVTQVLHTGADDTSGAGKQNIVETLALGDDESHTRQARDWEAQRKQYSHSPAHDIGPGLGEAQRLHPLRTMNKSKSSLSAWPDSRSPLHHHSPGTQGVHRSADLLTGPEKCRGEGKLEHVQLERTRTPYSARIGERTYLENCHVHESSVESGTAEPQNDAIRSRPKANDARRGLAPLQAGYTPVDSSAQSLREDRAGVEGSNSRKPSAVRTQAPERRAMQDEEPDSPRPPTFYHSKSSAGRRVEPERRSSLDEVPKSQKAPPFHHSKSSPAEMHLPNDKPHAQSLDLDNANIVFDFSSLRGERAETMPYQRSRKGEKPRELRASNLRHTKFNEGDLGTSSTPPQISRPDIKRSTKYRYGPRQTYTDGEEYATIDEFRTEMRDPGDSRAEPSETSRIRLQEPSLMRGARDRPRAAASRYPQPSSTRLDLPRDKPRTFSRSNKEIEKERRRENNMPAEKPRMFTRSDKGNEQQRRREKDRKNARDTRRSRERKYSSDVGNDSESSSDGYSESSSDGYSQDMRRTREEDQARRLQAEFYEQARWPKQQVEDYYNERTRQSFPFVAEFEHPIRTGATGAAGADQRRSEPERVQCASQ